MNIQRTLRHLINLKQFVSCTLVIKPIRLSYNIQPCSMLSEQAQASDLGNRTGWKINSLLGDANTSFKTISFGLWYYYYQQTDGKQYQIGITTGYNSLDLSLENNLIGFWHNGNKQNVEFSVNLGSKDSQILAFSSFADSYSKQWRSAMLIFYSSSGQGYLQITDATFQNQYLLSVNVGQVANMLQSYPDAFLNIDYSVGSVFNYNSCSRQKDIFFHYSTEQEYSLDYIFQLQFKTSTLPLFYFDFKQYDNQSQVVNISPKKKFINLMSIGINEATNGDQLGNNQLLFQTDSQFGYQTYYLGQNSIIVLPQNQISSNIILSCYIKYDSSSTNIVDQIQIFSSDNQNLIISIIQINQSLFLSISINNIVDQSLKFGDSDNRHSFQIMQVGNRLQQTQIKYYVDDKLIGTVQINSPFLLNQYIQIGSTKNDQSLGNFSFSIQDFIFFTNSILVQPSDIDQTDSILIVQNCNLFVSSSLGTTGFAYCLVCNQDYAFDINGVCNTNQEINPKSPRPQVKNLFQAQKLQSVISSTTDPSQSDIQFQIDQNGISDFLILGYFKLTSQTDTSKKTPLITVSVQGEWYNFLNLYLNDDTNFELKQIIDNLNDLETIQQQLPFSILNKWFVFGIGYQLNQKISYTVYQDIYSNQLQKIQIASQYQLDSRITTLSVCIACQTQAISIFSSFVGQVSSLKIIYQPSIQNIFSYQFIFEGNVGNLALLNPDFLHIVSLKDIYTFNYDADLTVDCLDNYFYLGVCMNSLYCPELGGQQHFLGKVNSMFADESQKACNYCDSTCIKCTSQSACLQCQVGYTLDQSSQCQPCISSQYFDIKLNQCVSICSIGFQADKINQMCVQNFDLKQYEILPKFQLSYFLFNEGFYQIDTFGDIQLNEYTICFIDFPYLGYSFFGSSSAEAGYSVYMQWDNFPVHYKKQVNFYVTLFNQQTIDDLQVQINGIQAQFIQSKQVTNSINYCQGSNVPINIYKVYYELLNNDSNYQLAIQTLKQGFAVRNVNVSVHKCHNTCVTCENGPKQTDCIECQIGNASKINNQCICQQNQFATFMNCYSPPCFKCISCTLSNCKQCEDFTGNCLKCQTGFVIQDGKCQKTCNQFYSIDKSQTNQVCVKIQDLAISNFVDGRVVQYLDFWNLSFKYTGTFSCFQKSYLPVISQGQYYQLQYNFNNFQSYHNQIIVQISVIQIGQFSTGDQILISESNAQVLQQPIQSNQLSCSVLSSFSSAFNKVQIDINKVNGQINLVFLANISPGTNQQSLSIGQFQLFFQRIQPLCASYDQMSFLCSACFENASLDTNGNCNCQVGYYYSYDYTKTIATCNQCNIACKSCSGPSFWDCIKCAEGYIYDGSKCVFCDTGFYFDKQQLKCLRCDTFCYQCTGPSKHECVSCTLGFYLYRGRCYENCKIADPSSVQDNFSKQCVQNKINYGEQLFYFNEQFTVENIVLYVKSKTLGIDQKFYCGENKYDMIGLFFQFAQFSIPNLQPHQTLKIQFQAYFTSGCMNCSIQLTSLTGQVIVQTVDIQQQDCDINSLISFSFIIQESSFTTQDYQFTISVIQNINFAVRNIQVSTIICHQTCAKCTGPLETDCTECPPNTTLDPTQNICRCTQVGFGFGISDQSLCISQFSCLQCIKCQYPCKTCYAANAYSCNTCAQNYIPFLEYCVDQCPPLISLQHLNKQTNQVVCIPCPKSCLECNSNGSCLSCLNGYVYLQDKQQCLTSCPTNNYYLDKSTNTCLNCHYTCLSCSGPTQYDCIKCIDETYYDIQLNICNYCNSLCQTCTSSTNYDCIQCSQDVALFQPTPNLKICTVQCDEYPGYFFQQYTDQSNLQSVSMCSKCAQNCISCYSSQNGCYQCADGFFLNENYECDPCDDSCLTCNGYKQNNCLSCIQPLVLFKNQCFQNCPLKYYINYLPNNTQECIVCPSQCITCSSKKNCSTCAYGYYKQDAECLQCKNNCEICYGLQGLYCQKCRQSYFLQNNLCVKQCQVYNNIGHYMDIASRTCLQCDQSCLNCVNPQSTGCTSCRDGYYLFSGICYVCPSNSVKCYYDNQQKQILSIQCASPYFLFYGFCKKSCPLSFYQDITSNTCKLCNVACSQCTGPLSNQCQSCYDGYFYAGQNTCLPCKQGSGVGFNDCISCLSFNYCLKCQTLINFNGMCLSQCLQSYYFNKQLQNCQKCNYPCLNCLDLKTCTSCMDGYYLQGNKCLKCDVKCLTCNGGTDQDCLLCNQPFMPQQIDKIECVIKCNVGFYQSNQTCLKCNKACSQCINQTNICDVCADGYYKNPDNSCQPCEDFCQICSGANSCTQCQDGHLIFKGSCLDNCPQGYLNLNGICIPCNPSCKSCSMRLDNCIACNDGYYLYNNTCLPCVNNCSLCNSSTICTKCQLGYFLEDSTCKTKCQKLGYYSDYSQYMCLPCDTSCATCISGALNQCSSCYDGYYLENDPQSKRCLSCNPLCTQCYGASNSNCLRCRQGVKFDQINTTCISCPTKHFYNSLNGICEQCSPLCLECFGPSKNNCLSCDTSMFLNINTDTCEACFPSCSKCFDGALCIQCQQGFYLIDNQYCLQQCPNQMRVLDDKCLCNETCAKCTYDPINNKSICIRCISDQYLLYNNQPNCIKTEDCQQFKDFTTNSCVQQCPSEALYIDLVNKTCQYSQCSSNQYLFNSKYCIKSCPDNFYADSQNICQPCDKKCQKCFGPSDNDCIECIQNYYFHQGINACKDSCIVGYVLQDQNSYLCQICQQNCKACINSLVLFQGDCLQKCPQGFSEQIGGQCIYNPEPSVRIYNLQQNQTISLIQDTQIEASLFSLTKPIKIQWDIIQTNDNSFLENYLAVQSFNLFQLIPYIILSPQSYYVFRITIELAGNIQIQDAIQLNTPKSIQEGKFLTDKKQGYSQSSFVFFISDWYYDQIIYYDLSFYEVFGMQQSENLNLENDNNSSGSSNNKIYDFYKDNLFRVYKHNYLEGSIQFTYTFQPILVNVSLICELKVYDDQNYDTVYKYILLNINSYEIPQDEIETVNQALIQIKNTNETQTIQNLIFNYSFLMRILIIRDQNKEQSLKNQIKLRSIAYLSGVEVTQLSSCDNTIDCYGNGICQNNLLQILICSCQNGYFGYNCEWNEDEYNIINESFLTILQKIQTFEDIVIIQIIENIAYYFSLFSSNTKLLQNAFQIFLNATQSYIANNQIDQVDGQILQRTSSYIISQLQGLMIDIQDLIQLNFKISQMISSTLNIGDKLISYSNSSNSIFYPYLITSTTNNTKSNRRILQNSQQDSQSKQNVTLSLSSFTVQFPAEVIYSSSKQVITAQQWTKDPRQAPFAISQTVSLQIQQNGKEVNVKDTSQPIIIVLPKIIPSPISEDTSSMSCSFYDEDTNSFKNEGCTFVKETILNIVCSCTHLTDFTAQKIQNQSKKNQVDLGSLVKTMNQEQQKLSNLNQKVVITSLPTLSIGQRYISLVSQLQVIQSGGINQFLKKNMIVLKEDPDYIDDNFDILQQDFISLYYDQEVNQSQNVGQFQINKLEALFYMLTVFVIIFHISMRACLRLGSTKLSQLQLSLIKEIQKQIQKLLNNELKRIKVQKQKFEKAKVIQKKFDMSKFKFTLQEQRASIKTGNQKKCEQNIIKTQKKESVIRFQDQEQEILTQSPPLILLELEQKFSPQGMKLEADISQDKNQHFENQMSLFQKKQDDQETMLSDKDSFPSFSKSQSPMVYDYSKSPIQNSTTYKRSIFSRNQVTYMKFNQIESQFMLTQQDDCVDDNQYYDTKCTDGNLITESNLLISNRQDKVQNKNQEYLFFRDDSHNKNQTTDYIKQNNLLQQLTQFDDDDDNDKEEEKTNIKEEKKTLEQFTPKNIMLQINKQKNMVASREIRNQQYKSNFLELFYQKPAKQNIYQTLSDSKNCLDTNSFQQFTFTEQSDSIFETSNLNTSHTQSMNQINEIQMFQSEKNSNLNNQKEFQLTPIQKNKKSIKKTVKQFKVDENYQNVIKNQRQKLTNPRYKSMKNYLQTKNLLENIKENNKFLQDAKKKSYIRRQTKVENLSKFQKEIDDKKRISVIAQFSQNFYFLKNEKIKSSKAFKFIQSVWKKKLISQSLENLLEIKKLINILKNYENVNPLNSVVNTQRRQLLAYLYGYLSHECQNGEHVLQNYQKEYESDFQPSQMEENQLLKQKLQSLKQQIKNFVKNNKKTDQRNMEQFDNYKRQDLIGNDHFVQLFKKYSYNKIDYVLDEDNLLEFLKQQINMKISLVKIIDFALDSQLNITKFDIIQLFSLFRQQSRIYSSQFTKCLLFCTQVVITATVNVLLIPYTSNQDVDLTKVSITYSNPRVFISLILGYLISYFSFGCLTGIFAKSTKCLETINLNQIYISQKIFQLLYLLIGLFQIGFSLKYLYSIKDDQKIQHQFEFSSFFIEIIASILLSNALIDGLLYIYYILIAKHKYEDETQSRFLFILACRGYYYFKGFDNIKIHELLLIKDAIPYNLRN
ncbi:hypothetical protein ABPG72_017981 [Tetrahymena utriculariae]